MTADVSPMAISGNARISSSNTASAAPAGDP